MHTCPPLEVTTGQGVSVGRPYQYNTQQDSRQRVQRLPRSVMRRPDTRSQEIVDLTVAATDDADSTPRPNSDQGNDQLVNAFIIDLAMQTTSNNVQDTIEGTTTDMPVETGEQLQDLTRYMARRQSGQSPLRPTETRARDKDDTVSPDGDVDFKASGNTLAVRLRSTIADDVDTTKRKVAAEDLTYMEVGGDTRANTLDYWLSGRMKRTGDRHVTAPDAETETGSDGSSLSVGRLCTVDVVTTKKRKKGNPQLMVT